MQIELNGVGIDLSRDIDFHYELNDQQLGALETIAKFLDSETQVCTMQGSAGVGKTTIVKILLHYLMVGPSNRMALLCAPTHKAKMVLQKASSEQVSTVHSILNLKPNFNVMKFDARELDFLSEPQPTNSKYKKMRVGIPWKGLVIIDEASMINNDLESLIRKRCKEKQCKILYIGDIAQLQPVKQGTLSRVFDASPDNIVIKLTKVERQAEGNPLLKVLTTLRDEPVFHYETSLVNHSGTIAYNSELEYLRSIKNTMTADAIIADPYRSRILTYTNKNAARYNRAMRKIMGFTDPIEVGDLLMATDGHTKRDEVLLVNSCDYLVLRKHDCEVVLPEYGKVPGYELELRDLACTDGSDKVNITMLRSDLEDYIYISIAQKMESFRLKAIAATRAGKSYAGMFWRNFYALNEAVVCMQDLSFDGRVIKKKTLAYGYAHTVHKSQGCTYDNIFIDMVDVMKCQDQSELRQLQYVALSRARKKAHILI